MTGRAKRRAGAFAVAATTSIVLVACGEFGTSEDKPTGDAAGADSAITNSDAEADAAPPSESGKADAPSRPDRYIFTTAGAYTGAGISSGGGGASGLAAADYICNGSAKLSKSALIKSRSFKAWLGTAASPAKSRIPQDENRPIRRSDGELVAGSWSAFAAPTHPGNAIVGDPRATTQDKRWTNADTRACSEAAHFYCIED